MDTIRIDLGGVNCYLLKDGESFILFDTGGHTFMDRQFTNRRETLVKELEKAGCRPGNLKLLVLTHGDNDHTANAAFIREQYKTKIAMHPDDLELVENPDIKKVMNNCHYKSLIFKVVFVFMKKLIVKVTLKTLDDFEKFTPDIYLEDAASLLEYGFNATVIHTPGHTGGSIGVLTAEGDLIAGDTFANMKKPDTAPNACDFKVLAASVNKLKKLKIKKIFPGHGSPFDAVQLI